MVKLRDIFQSLYPYAIFRAGKELSANNQTRKSTDRTRTVYLTFDDGPIPEVTPKVLAILAKYNLKATFFMVGENIDKHPEVFAQVVQAGHSIGNHTYNHLKGWKYSKQEYLANVQKWEEAAKNKFSLIAHRSSLITLFRPPYGKATFCQRRALHKMGYQLIYWDILTKDYEATRTPEQMLRLIQRETRSGSIINFHDSLKSNERMLTVLPQAIEWLQKEGYEIREL